MKLPRWISLFLVLVLLVACNNAGPTGTPTHGLPTAGVTTVPAPDTESALKAFLDALKANDFKAMYAELSSASQSAVAEADFEKAYTDALTAMSVSQVDYTILILSTNPTSAQATFNLVYRTALFGDIQREMKADFVLEKNAWKLQWNNGLILPELADGSKLKADYTPVARGDIYDRSGNAIATNTDVYALGLTAGAVSEDVVDAVLTTLSRLTRVPRKTISDDYYAANNGDYVAVGEASAEAVDKTGVLGYTGVVGSHYEGRFYEPNTAPNAVGYVTSQWPEDGTTYQRLGYGPYDLVGRLGIEAWGQPYLGGRDSATLKVVSADGSSSTVLSQVNSQPASSLTLTIDSDLQQQAQAAMDGYPGAIVVMEVNTGKVLAMVSSPGFDPNYYNGDNANRTYVNESPTFNRATMGLYPLGSVFKIISMAAALESGIFSADSTLDCQYEYTEITGHTLYDWTWQDCQKQMAERGDNSCPSWPPSGMLTLPQGLMRSCDPWFYHIGYTLYNAGQSGTLAQNYLEDMARAFGLGRKTGIEQVDEKSGNIPNPTDGLNATSIAIGQGDVQVTPLQVADFIAAVANGGTLYRPQLVDKIQPVSGDPISIFKPQANGTLPVKPENLKLIQEAMRQVAVNKNGTAYYTFGNFAIPVAAKTGTAEASAEKPYAWFAGYSMANNPDKPDIAVAVVVEGQGEGATYAAPILRRIMEIYFYGHPGPLYRWETSMGVANPDYGQPVTPTPAP